MDSTQTPRPQFTIYQIVLIVGDFLLLGLLLINGWKLWGLHQHTQELLSSPILSNNPEALLDQIASNGVPWWAWVIQIGGLAITIFLILAWFIPKLRQQLPMTLFNSVWIAGWLGYIVLILVLLVVAASSLLSFT